MATLQKTLIYLGLGALPTDVRLEFEVPVFKYTELRITKSNDADNTNAAKTIIQREIVKRYKVNHQVLDNEYAVDISDCETIWKGDFQIRQRYLAGLFRDVDVFGKSNLEDISFIVTVNIYYKDVLYETQEIEVADIIAKTKGSDYEVFFINKKSYAKLVDLLNIGAFSNVLLVSIFLSEIKISNGFKYIISQGKYLELVEKYLKTAYEQIAEDQRAALLDQIPTLLERIKAFDLNSLFDFPISIPEFAQPETLNVGGTFTMETDNAESISAADLSHYDLLLEYFNGSSSRNIHYDWDLSQEISGNQPIDFSFAVEDYIRNSFFINVKGVNGNSLWQREFKPTDENLNEIQIRVPLVRPNTLSTLPDNTTTSGKKLRGQVIQVGNSHSLHELTVLIQAKMQDDTLWRIVSATKTDRKGNFSMAYPYGNYSQAEALLSVTPDNPTPVRIIQGSSNETIADDFLYLILTDNQLPKEASELKKDCACDSPIKAKRLPDQADLIESDEYTQDVGGGCINLTTPNRTLREYQHQAIVRISDPGVANYTLEKVPDNKIGISFRLNRGPVPYFRKLIGLDNPILWQDAPGSESNLSLYQAVTVATGHILYYKSVFKADGYSLGDLLYSLPLAPGQKKQIVVFDSSHSLTGAESQTISQGESLTANLINDRTITDELSGTISERLDGRSNATTSGISAGLGAGGSMGPIGGTLGVSGGYANANSAASQNSSRDISQFFGERLRQSVMQNAESYRQLNATVVTTVKEGQQYAVTTESVANHNHCHALTMMYFEVLRHYAIYQELSHVEECVFVPLLMTNFTIENISKWKDILATHLLPLPSSTHLQPLNVILRGRKHPLLKAFDANDRIKSDYENLETEYADQIYAKDIIESISGELTLMTNLQRPKTRYDRIKSFPIVSRTVSTEEFDPVATAKANLKMNWPWEYGPRFTTVNEEILERAKIFDAFMTLDANFQSVPPAQCIRVHNFMPISTVFGGREINVSGGDFFAGNIIDKDLWITYASLLGYNGDDGVYEMLNAYFKDNLIAEWDSIFYNDIIPEVFNRIVDKIRFKWYKVTIVGEDPVTREPLAIRESGGFRLDFSSTSKYVGGERNMNIRFRGTASISREDFTELEIVCESEVVRRLLHSVTLSIGSVNINYATARFNGPIYRGYLGDDLLDGVKFYAPLNSNEKRNPRNEDLLLVKQLLEHLNSNLEYYNKILWYNLDPDRRYMLLDGFHIQIYDDSGITDDFRSLASVVKNQLITITGNSLVFPVAAGYRVSASYIVPRNTEPDGTTQPPITLLDHYKPFTPIPPYRISVPTRGVFMEAIPGVCDSCEKVKANSSQDWDKFRVDEPTPIATVVTPTPAITDWKAAFKDFAQPLVNIQNAPGTPAPGAGLAGLSELLGKSGVFNDITGLQGNQQNALQTYLSNQENVRALAEMAKTMGMQQHNTQHSQSITDSIAHAREAGAITPDQESSLVRQHLQQQIDGGETLREQARIERERERPSLVESAVEAAGEGRTVRAQRTDADGNTESVDIRRDEGQAPASDSDVDVGYDVPAMVQPNTRACWATAATMMVSWKHNTSYIIEDVLRMAGNNLASPNEDHYLSLFTSNAGLAPSEKDTFLRSLGMIGEPPANFQLARYVELLRTYGPLWITTDANIEEDQFSSHARILTRIEGNISTDPSNVYFYFIDPADGSEVMETFEEFIDFFEQLVTDDPDPEADAIIQIVHFRDRIATHRSEGEGDTNPPYSGISDGVIERIWVWSGGAIPQSAIENPSSNWWSDRAALGMTDFVVALNDYNFEGGLGIRPQYIGTEDTIWRPTCRILEILDSKGISPHLMIFCPPNVEMIREAALMFSEIIRMSAVMPRSIQLDLEGWWTSRSSEERQQGVEAIRQYFYNEWTSEKPELGIGITCIGGVPGNIRSALEIVDFAVPQMYASSRNYSRPINERLVQTHHRIAAEALAAPNKKIIIGQTANGSFVDPLIMKRMLEIILTLNHSNTNGVREVAYWSDTHLFLNRRNQIFFERLTTIVRNEGLRLDNISSL